MLAFAAMAATEKLVEQNDDSTKALQDAEEARLNALLKSELRYKSKETKKLMKEWEDAEDEVRSLRKRFNISLQEGDYFYAYAERKRDTIADSEIRMRISETIENRKVAFTRASIATEEKITNLEAFIQYGNDVFTALEIVGVLNAMDDRIVSLTKLSTEAISTSKEVRALHDEAKKMLEIEMEFAQ